MAKRISVMLGAWLIPGLGFWVNGARKQAIILFILIELLFAVGLCLSGTIVIPSTFNPMASEANIVAILSFIVQFFNGGGLIISQVLPANETASFSDLGSFWLMVSSGLNYFAMLSVWDHFYGAKRNSQNCEFEQEEVEK
ncbi:hypothetical protein GX645_05285 [Candidatus Sumerlaeota bacterium]|nr:hypothetical protein [Candidatus Sumerlaeales bacterium]NLD61848.1 hypothetical protein [Candidatus Sumerlaeota bacterium]